MSHTDDVRCWPTVAESTCAVCLDRTDEGACEVPARGDDCPVRTFFTEVVKIVRREPGSSMEAVFAAVEAEICPRCREMGADGNCGRRARGECALYAYLPITVDAIEEGLRDLARENS